MKKFIAVLSVIAVILFSFNLGWFNKAEAATVGEKLTEPENGWKRYDDTDAAIKYVGVFTKATYSGVYKNTQAYPTDNKKENNISFKFKGTKLRIIDAYFNNRGLVEIEINGQKETYKPYNSSTILQAIVYEKLNLENKIHTVTMKFIDTNLNYYMVLDAIDIDADGELLPPDTISESLKLNKESLDLTVGSSESLVATISPEDASNKTIKWTSSNPEIASVDDNGNVIGKKPGKVTVNAETTDGSNLSATCEVTVKDAEVDGNRAILKIKTVTGELHEYDLPMTEINKFINWLDGRDKGEGKPYYKFKLNVTVGNIDARTEYIMYDKIDSFVIDEYK